MTESGITTRTSVWRRVWDRIPGWARAGLWGLLVLLLVQIVVAVRIWYGLQDPPEVAAIRRPGVHISIPAAYQSSRRWLDWLEVLPRGLRGLSGKDVTFVRLGEQATDELVAHIAAHFPNVHDLDLANGNATASGLLTLKSCKQLWRLDISDTDIDDGLAELLPLLPSLNSLSADYTNVGDDFAQAAAKHGRLEYCSLQGTNVTPEAGGIRKGVGDKLFVTTNADQFVLRGTIHWSDGQVSRRFNGPYELGIYGPQANDGSATWNRTSILKSTGLRGHQLQWSPQHFNGQHLDGTYQLRLKLDDIEAEPVNFTVEYGVPSLSRIEFRMPVPRPEPPR